MTDQPTITDTHTWDGTHHLPDWLHQEDGHLALPGRDDTTPPQPGWMLVRWSDGLITVASPQVAARAFGPDGMRGRLERAEAELADRDAAESADAAAGSYAGRAETAEQQRDQLAALVRDFLDPDPCQLDNHGYCQAHGWAHDGWHCPHARAREALAALDDEAAIAQPERWLHVAFTSPDETTANTSALAIADHLRAEFPGVGMRITTNAVEVGTHDARTTPAATEATGIETTARVLAALHRTAEDTVTRVIDLHERWVTAGPPPLGVPTARWWDARLVELHDAINPAAEQPARTTAKNPSCSPGAGETEPNNSAPDGTDTPPPDDLTGVWTPDPPIGCLLPDAEPNPAQEL